MKSLAVEPNDTQSYVFVGDQRLARIEHDKQSWFYYLKDHLGSSDIVMNKDNVPVEQMIYRAYGSEFKPEDQGADGANWASHQTANTALMPNEKTHHRFTGHYLDDDTGLYYFGARYYDPGLGRFVSADPLFIARPEVCIEDPMSCGLYNYARNNPIKFTDPTGLAPGDIWLYRSDGSSLSDSIVTAQNLIGEKGPYSHASIELDRGQSFSSDGRGSHIEDNSTILKQLDSRTIDIYRHKDSSSFNVESARSYAESTVDSKIESRTFNPSVTIMGKTMSVQIKTPEIRTNEYILNGVCSTNTASCGEAGGLTFDDHGAFESPNDLSTDSNLEKVGSYDHNRQQSIDLTNQQ